MPAVGISGNSFYKLWGATSGFFEQIFDQVINRTVLHAEGACCRTTAIGCDFAM